MNNIIALISSIPLQRAALVFLVSPFPVDDFQPVVHISEQTLELSLLFDRLRAFNIGNFALSTKSRLILRGGFFPKLHTARNYLLQETH
jgi:hypothetical protein